MYINKAYAYVNKACAYIQKKDGKNPSPQNVSSIQMWIFQLTFQYLYHYDNISFIDISAQFLK